MNDEDGDDGGAGVNSFSALSVGVSPIMMFNPG